MGARAPATTIERSRTSMKRISAIGLALAAVFALVAVAAASASAATWKIEGKEFTGEEKISSTGGPFTLTVPKLGVAIKCEKEANTGKIFSKNKDESTIEFTKCAVEKAANCTVKEPIKSEVNTELIEVGGVVYDKFTPKKEPFTTITLEGSGCVLKGSYEVKGTEAGQVGAEAVESTLTFSEAISKAAGTVLTFGADEAFLAGTSSQKLTGKEKGKKWN
jgi:hypothetical protein